MTCTLRRHVRVHRHRQAGRGRSDEGGVQPYRFNAKRWDAQSGTYDMGFREYNPGLNRFTTRDMYNGALADMGLGADPYTGNRYAFAGGNPTTNIELDGHGWCDWCSDTASAVGGWFSDNSDTLTGIGGDLLQTTLGVAGLFGGADMMAGGAAMCIAGGIETLGASCVAGAAVAVSGFATAAAGATTAVQGASNLGKDLGNLRSADSGSSGGGSAKAAEPESIDIEGLNNPWGQAERDTIESELGGNLPDRFPYIDAWDAESGTATSVKTIDWRRDTYKFSNSAISSTGKKYVQDMVNFSKNGASGGGVSVTPDMVNTNQLKIAFPSGASDSQLAAFQKIVSYGEQYGIKVNLYAVGG